LKIKAMLNAILIFFKAQVSAFMGGLIDYAVMIFFTEILYVHYTISIAIGGIVGAVVNFTINRNWSFYSKDKFYKHSKTEQLFKFSLVVLNSIILKSGGTYLISSYWGIDYKISRIITDLIVSIAFNYTFQMNWVFKHTNLNEYND